MSPHFPPSALAGAHRARHLAKHLPATGWHPTIVCFDERYQSERLDPNLCSLVAPNTQIIKVPALPVGLTRYIRIGDISLRGWFHLKRTLNSLISRARPDVVLITGAPFYPMLLAPWIKKKFNLPIVLDFQDPWVSNWGEKQPAFSKAGMAHRLATTAEPKVVAAASFITGVSHRQNQELASRYPWLDEDHMRDIPIGGDSDDFTHLPENASSNNGEFLQLNYVGSFWPKVKKPIESILAALALFQSRFPELAQKLMVNFLGTDSSLAEQVTHQVRPLALNAGVSNMVIEDPRRLPYLNALAALKTSDAILLVGSDEPHYTASKIYPALQAGRPFISLFHADSSAHDILNRAGGGRAFGFKCEGDLDALHEPLITAFHDLCQGNITIAGRDDRVIEPYTAKASTEKYATIFNQLVGGD